jgi:hypothetical protein
LKSLQDIRVFISIFPSIIKQEAITLISKPLQAMEIITIRLQHKKHKHEQERLFNYWNGQAQDRIYQLLCDIQNCIDKLYDPIITDFHWVRVIRLAIQFEHSQTSPPPVKQLVDSSYMLD